VLLTDVLSENVRSVYLASVGRDMAEYRERLRRELAGHGYVIESHGGEGERRIDDARDGKATASIHLLGNQYDSAVEEELRTAVEQSHSDRECIVWISPDADPDVRQRELLAGLEAQIGPHVQIVRGPFHTLRDHVLDTLSPRRRRGAVRLPQQSAPTIMVACDRADVDDAARLTLMLQELGAAAQLLDVTADVSRLAPAIVAHEALIFYWGKGRQEWVERVINEAKRTVPAKPFVVYVAEPFQPGKEYLRGLSVPRLEVIEAPEEASRAEVAEFVRRLRDESRSGGQS
jgi:hypothetical protein